MSLSARAGSTASYWPRPAAAWSTRLLNKSYYGALLRVRRSSDNAELDIGFDVNDLLDTATLLTFAGGGNAYVSKWYDQFPGAFHGLQSYASNQSQIVNAGSLIVEPNGSRPALAFNNSVNYYVVSTGPTSIIGGLDQNCAIVSVASITTKVATPFAEKPIYGETKVYGSRAYLMTYFYIYGSSTIKPSPRIGYMSDDGNAANAAMSYGGGSGTLNKTYVNVAMIANKGNWCVHYQNSYTATGPTIQSYNFHEPIPNDYCLIGSVAKDTFVAPMGPGFIEEVRIFRFKLTDFQRTKMETEMMTHYNTSGY
jgi:hypothetical protein